MLVATTRLIALMTWFRVSTVRHFLTIVIRSSQKLGESLVIGGDKDSAVMLTRNSTGLVLFR